VGVGYDVHRSTGVNHTVLGAVGVPRTPVHPSALELLPGVAQVLKISEPYKLVGRTFKPADTVVTVAGVKVGGVEVIAMAGPCSVESEGQVREVARSVAAAGARVLRGGAFKPRTSPYSFQGHGETALQWMRTAADESGLAVVSEIMDPRALEMMLGYVDCLQVGARNMQNFELLKELGRVRKPVLLKRGLAATIEEWLLSAEYVLSGGNPEVILCERGIRTFDRGGEGQEPPSHPGRPQPRHGPSRPGHPHGPGRGGGGRGRPAHRGPQRSREGALRRGAEPLPGAVRSPDG
jgi:3-deoxy-7-phosphoheptulonate synthase